jgi:acyl-coenzyme A thioesterase PaaI-like protein
MTEQLTPLPINSMIDRDSQRLAAALRRINNKLVSSAVSNEKVSELADQCEKLADVFEKENGEKRQRDFGTVKEDETSAAGSGYDYGKGNTLSYQPISGNCNAISPQVKYFRAKEAYVLGKVTFSKAYEGPPGHVHGGYLAACLDEVFGIAASHSYISDPCMTGTLTLKYRIPVPIEQEITYKGWVEREEGRKVFLKCTVTDQQGQLFAEGEAIFLKIDPALYQQLSGR